MAAKKETWEERLEWLANAYMEARERVSRTAVNGTPPPSLCQDLRSAAFELAEHYVSTPDP